MGRGETRGARETRETSEQGRVSGYQKGGAARAVHVLALHLPGGLNFDRPRSNVIGVIGRGGFFFDNSNEIVAIKEAGDGDGSVGVSKVGDKAKGGVAELGDSSVEFCEVVRAGAGAADDDHGTKVAGLCFAAEVGL